MSADDTAHLHYGPPSSQSLLRWLWYWGPVVCYAGLIFYLSAQAELPQAFPPFLERLGDKVYHMVEYGVFGLLWYRAFRFAGGRWSAVRAVMLTVVASVVYGVGDEIHQYFVPMRQADAWDVAADAAGATIAALSAEWWVSRQPVRSTTITGS